MGFSYLDGRTWCEVTRDERFFCQRLYEHINAETPASFVHYLCRERGLNVPVEGHWELGFEVCFYRDLWHLRGKQGSLFSPKRTFDLCFFGENSILIVEAKAAVDFNLNQNASFARDIQEVKRQTGLASVELLGLCSSKCSLDPTRPSVFSGPILTWKQMAERYSDPVLTRADDVYEPGQPFMNTGRHSTTKLTGSALLEASPSRATWWVGRTGGLNGVKFQEDVRSGTWRTQKYEVNTEAIKRPSPNYFHLSDFARAVEKGTLG